jgi:hypothetical protein
MMYGICASNLPIFLASDSRNSTAPGSPTKVASPAQALADHLASGDRPATAAVVSAHHQHTIRSVDDFARTKDQRDFFCGVGLEHVDLALQTLGSQDVVLRQQLEIAASGLFQAPVPVAFGAEVAGIPKQTDSRVVVASDNRGGVVGELSSTTSSSKSRNVWLRTDSIA